MADKSLTLGTLFTANATQFIATVSTMKQKVGQLNTTFASIGSKGAKGINAATKSVNKLGGAMGAAAKQGDKHKKSLRGVAGALDRIKAAAKITAAFALAAAAITAVTTALRAGIQEIIDYDQGLKNLQAITNATDQEVAAMGETIKDVARTTKFSTAEVAEGMTLLGQAGFDATEAIQAMQAVSDLATGTLSNMQFTTDLMTTTIRAFGMSTVESAKAADIMANAINRSKLTIDKLRIAFNFVGAAAHQAGLTLEETAATMMVLANQGLRASTIGTGLRQVLSRLLAPTGKLREEFEANNIELNKVNPSLVGFRQALENLLPVIYDQAEGTVDMAKAYQLFGLRGAQAAAVLASAVASGNYDKMLELTYETGTAARMAAKQIEGLGLKFKNMADRARLVAVALGEAGLITAIGAIVDGLKQLFTGIETFIGSNIGQAITAFVGWTAAIFLTVKGIQLLIKMVRYLGLSIAALTTKVWAAAASQAALGKSITTGSKVMAVFGSAVRGLPAPLLLVAAAIGAVVAISRIWVTSTERRIKALEKDQSETITLVQSLELYADVLEKLMKKQSKGKDITDEHARAIRRMSSDTKESLPFLLESAKYIELNKEQLEDAFDKEMLNAINQQVELIKQYQKEVEEAAFWSGLWNMTIGKLEKSLGGSATELTNWGEAAENVGLLIPRILGELTGTREEFDKLYFSLKTNFVKGMEDIGDFYSKWVGGYAENSDTVKEKTEQVDEGMVKLGKLIDQLARGKKPLEDIVRLVEDFTGKEVGIKTFEAIKEAIADITLTLKDEQANWEGEIDQLPTYFQEMYKDMDGLRKANFAKAVKAMNSELAAFEKTADQMNLKEEERSESRSAIRARHLAKFASDSQKEVAVTEESVREQIRMLDILAKGTEEMSNKRTTAIINSYLKQVEIVGDNKKQLLEIEKVFLLALKREHEKLNKELLNVDKQRQEDVLRLEKQTVEEIKILHKKIMEDLKKQLNDQYKAIKAERDGFLDDLVNLDKSYENTIRSLRQKTMTDEERWLDDRKHAHELMNRARATGDTEMYEEAMRLAASLGREVKNDSGEVVRTIEANIREATDIVNQIHIAHTALIKKEVADRERQMRSLKEEIKAVDKQLVEFGETIDALNRKEMVIRADKTIAELQKVYNVNHNFKEEWDALESKTIVLTVKYNYVGKASGGGGSESTGEGGGESEAGADTGGGEGGGDEEGRWGGYVQRKIGGAIEKAMAIGGKLRGYGGGDKVKALLEPGEFVVRKEAVKKYGGHVFEGLNNMTSPAVASGVGKRLGGMITDGFRRFQFGGGVPAHAAMSANQQTFNITLRPKYLTGDRQAMRSMAKDVTKAVEEQSRRWGKN